MLLYIVATEKVQVGRTLRLDSKVLESFFENPSPPICALPPKSIPASVIPGLTCEAK